MNAITKVRGLAHKPVQPATTKIKPVTPRETAAWVQYPNNSEVKAKIEAQDEVIRYTCPAATLNAVAQAYWAGQPTPPLALAWLQVRAGEPSAAALAPIIVVRAGVAHSVNGAAL